MINKIYINKYLYHFRNIKRKYWKKHKYGVYVIQIQDSVKNIFNETVAIQKIKLIEHAVKLAHVTTAFEMRSKIKQKKYVHDPLSARHGNLHNH